MTKPGLLEFDGHVTQANTGGLFAVTLDNHVEILAQVCGHVRCYWMRLAPGGRARVGRLSFATANGSNPAQHEQRCHL
jgi:translation initiation factor IF-1